MILIYVNFCFLLSFLSSVSCFYSIGYVSKHPQAQLQGQTGQTFIEAPSAEHVADLYARLSGFPPLLREDAMNLPSTDIFGDNSVRPFLVEAHGGSKLFIHISVSLTLKSLVSQHNR